MIKALFPMTLLFSVCCTCYWGSYRTSHLLNLVTILSAEKVVAEMRDGLLWLLAVVRLPAACLRSVALIAQKCKVCILRLAVS